MSGEAQGVRGRRVVVAGALTAALVAATVGVVAATSPADSSPDRAAPGQSSSPSPTATLPVILSSCYLPSTPTNVSVTTEDAMALTSLAAQVRDVERGRDRVETAVARAAPDDVTPEQVSNAADSLLGLRASKQLARPPPPPEI
jgi:hypothetical protein